MGEKVAEGGYMAPEYAMRGYLTPKADVYSFGILAMEIVSGKNNSYRHTEECFYLLDWAYLSRAKKNLLEMVDPDLGSEFSSEEALRILKVALFCTAASPSFRPTMSQTISMLEGHTDLEEFGKTVALPINDFHRYMASTNHFWEDLSETRQMPDEPHTESFVTESVTELS
ncbi:hypothetical protein L1987_62892 [Smallanthus sonchifolius]|uniref:Uncharacterized protein n=1 Tax=Smallanthus sonchifolius TaxID=185202 RepID=A0ACB9CBY7_9ASTR|nr:hypothetical protein L1987_62892 [Smallanthus sonchifolius]